MDTIEPLARKLRDEYPYGHEPFGLHGLIKLILWVLLATNVLKGGA